MTFRFGPFTLDTEAAELRKHGVRVSLQEQPLRILVSLLERPGEIVSREQLIATLWPEGTHVDFERGLNVAVTRLRQALSDSADSPRYVETVPKRGYRFIGRLDQEVQFPSQPSASTRQPRRPMLVIAGLIVAVTLATAVTLVRSGPRANRASEPTPPVPLTAYGGWESRPSLSPNGLQVAFDWDQIPGEYRIYTKSVDGGEPVRLTSATAVEFNPAWSPDARHIAFYRLQAPGGVGVYVAPASGGSERKVFEFTPWWTFDLQRTVFTGNIAWTSDSKALVVTASGQDPGSGFIFVSLDTGNHHWLMPPSGPNFLLHPSFSPDGRTFAFVRNTAVMIGDVYLAPFDPATATLGASRRLTRLERMMGGLGWLNGEALVISAGDNLLMNLYRVGREPGAVPIPLYFAGPSALQPSTDRNGSVAYTRRIRDHNIWRQEISSTPGRLPPAVKLIASTEQDTGGRYSPDGSHIAFPSSRSGSFQIWTCRADGSMCTQVSRGITAVNLGGPDWSPDGDSIAFHANPSGNQDIYVVGASGGKPKVLIDHPADDDSPVFSADGRYIYFESLRSGQHEIWRVAAGGGQPVQITRGGGVRAHEVGNGAWLVYARPAQAGRLFESLWLKSLRGSAADVSLLQSVYPRQWVVTGNRIYYTRPSPSSPELRSRHIFDGRDVLLGKVPRPSSPEPALGVSPDGRFLLFARNDNSGSDLVFIKNLH